MSFDLTLTNSSIRYEKDVITAKLSSIKAGGIADYVIYPKSTEEIVLSYRIARNYEKRIMTVGNMTNTVFSDNGFRGVLISTKALNDHYSVSSGVLYSDAGVPLPTLINTCARGGIRISAGLSGIPATVAGAIKNNAGAFGESVSDILTAVKIYSPDTDALFTLSTAECDMSYRSSVFKNNNFVILGAYLKYHADDKNAILEDISRYREQRRASQPHEPSLGSFFKNPRGQHASYLIDHCGLKGRRIGGAEVSQKHAGFIVNRSNASFADIKSLSDLVISEVFSATGYILEREAELIN